MQGFKVHYLCWLSIGFILLQRWIAFGEEIDLVDHDNYYEIGSWYLVLFLSVLFLIFGVTYWKLYPYKWKWTSQIALLQIGLGLVGVVLISVVGKNSKTLSNKSEEMAPEYLNNLMGFNAVFLKAALIMLAICLLIFMLIVLVNLTKRTRR